MVLYLDDRLVANLTWLVIPTCSTIAKTLKVELMIS